MESKGPSGFFRSSPEFDLWQDPKDAGLVAEAKKFAEENSDKKVGGPMGIDPKQVMKQLVVLALRYTLCARDIFKAIIWDCLVTNPYKWLIFCFYI